MKQSLDDERLLSRCAPRNDSKGIVIANAVKQSLDDERLLRRYTPRNDGVTSPVSQSDAFGQGKTTTVIANAVKQSRCDKRFLRRYTPRNDGRV